VAAAALGAGVLARPGIAAAQSIPVTAAARTALAPTGALRGALQQANPLNVVQDPGSGESVGVAYDLGRELARRLGVPFEPVLYPAVGPLLDAGKAGAWDVAFVGFSPARALEWDFTALHLEVAFGYLVPAGSTIATAGDAARPGTRLAVQQGSGPEAFFSALLPQAALVRVASNPAALEAVRLGQADAAGGIKPVLFELAGQLPGSRVLDDRPGIDPHAMALPPGRGPALVYARQFIEDAKAQGLIQAAINRAGVRGADVAPLLRAPATQGQVPTGLPRTGARPGPGAPAVLALAEHTAAVLGAGMRRICAGAEPRRT
jgi:polar amino acid transport system substrate-binding protein